MSLLHPTIDAMTEWRDRQTRAQYRGRTIECQAGEIRLELVAIADRRGDLKRLRLLVEGIRKQLELAEALASEMGRS